MRRWTIAPGELALECDDLDGLAGGEPEENATRVERLLEGEGRVVERCAVLLNAAAALYVSGNEWTLAESAARAREAMDQGKGAEILARLRSAAPRMVAQPAT